MPFQPLTHLLSKPAHWAWSRWLLIWVGAAVSYSAVAIAGILVLAHQQSRQSDNSLPMELIAATLALVMLLLGGLVAALQHFRRKAEELVAARTSDLEETKRLLAAVNRVQSSVLNGTTYGIIATDPAGLIEIFNRGASLMLGYTSAEMVGKATPKIVHLRSEMEALASELTRKLGRPVAPDFEAFATGAQAEGGDERCWTFVRKDGSHFPASLRLSALRDEAGVITGFLGVILDLTERKKADEASRLKSEFLAMMSHEIRTPMNAILGMAGMLGDSSLSAEQSNMTRTISSGAESLLVIINDILDLSRIEAGQMRLDSGEFDLAEVVQEVIALFGARAQEKRIELATQLDFAPTQRLMGDRGRIRQILLNLVGNAVKFTDAGAVTVSLESVNRAPGRVRVKMLVRDSGIGISAEGIAKLFLPFSQVDGSTTRRFGGTGLGLAITKQLVTAMSGEIGVESKPGQGSSFWTELELPTAARCVGSPPALAAAPSGAARPERSGGTARLRVLIAEDNAANQLVASMMLGKMGHLTEIAVNGQHALERLATASYDAVLMDCQMPELDGYEATRRIRSGQYPGINARIPIIAVTASARPEDRSRSQEAGMNGYISKPVRYAELQAALNEIGAAPQEVGAPPSTPQESALDLDILADLRALPGATGPSLLPELVEMFLQDEPRRREEIALLLRTQRADKLASEAHKFGGTAATFGSAEVHALAQQLEAAALASDWAAVRNQIGPFSIASSRLHDQVTQLSFAANEDSGDRG